MSAESANIHDNCYLSFGVVPSRSKVSQTNVFPIYHMQLDKGCNHSNIEGVALCSRDVRNSGITKDSSLKIEGVVLHKTSSINFECVKTMTTTASYPGPFYNLLAKDYSLN